jgi:hypothetical protein
VGGILSLTSVRTRRWANPPIGGPGPTTARRGYRAAGCRTPATRAEKSASRPERRRWPVCGLGMLSSCHDHGHGRRVAGRGPLFSGPRAALRGSSCPRFSNQSTDIFRPAAITISTLANRKWYKHALAVTCQTNTEAASQESIVRHYGGRGRQLERSFANPSSEM